MHVFGELLAVFSSLIASHKYPPSEKLFSVFVFMAALSLRRVSERLPITVASRESIRQWIHRFSKMYNPSKKHRRLVAVD